MGKIIDMTGWKMWEHGVPDSKLTVIQLGENKTSKSHKAIWECKCSCGSDKIVLATRGDLINGKIRSCGCLKVEANKSRCETHGESKTRLYRIWCGMRDRCYNQNNKKYCNYGGRGISICDEWRSYHGFRCWALENGYADDLSIDRIDVSGDYEPSNCRWTNSITQSNNRTNNHIVEFENKTMTVSELAAILKMPYNTVSSRINHLGYSANDCANTPIGCSKKGLHLIEYDGVTMTISDWAKKLDIPLATLSSRLNQSKWSVEKALTTPIDLSKRRK